MTSWYIMVWASVFTHSGRCEIRTGDFGATDNSWQLRVTEGLKQYKMVAIQSVSIISLTIGFSLTIYQLHTHSARDGKAFLFPPDLLKLVILASSLLCFLRVFLMARSIKAHVSWDSTAFSVTVSEESRAVFLMR